MQLTEHQKTVFLDRYAKRDKDNQPIETSPEQMWKRVANEIALTPAEAGRFYEILEGFRFVPGGRILAGAGTESEKTYYNCYVIPVETRARRKNRSLGNTLGVDRPEHDAGADSREAIFDTMAAMVDIMSRGGGVGINWSVLRPSGSYLSRISGTSSGPIGWMDVASKAVGEVIQGGSRRGAAMFMINDWHPDVESFVEAKTEAGKIENANISVAVSDDFMAAVSNDEEWALVFPDTAHPAYNTEWDGNLTKWRSAGYPVREYKTVRARDLWARLANSAWRSGEPGVVFLDRYNKQSTAQGLEDIICVNPCGEQGLGAYSVCNLGSMNLAAYVTRFTHKYSPDEIRFDWDLFEHDVKVAIRFLDNVIDKTYYHLPETKARQMALRRIGLGVMGLADALIMLGLRYGSSEAVGFTDRVFRTMKDAAIESSRQLAKERGPAEGWDDMMWDRPFLAEYASRHIAATPEFYKPLRNLFLLTQAPTGTTAALAGVNSGIEPYFAFEYTRKDRTGTHLIKSSIKEWAERNFSRDHATNVLVTSNDVSPAQHLMMQAAVQNNIDSSVSKTINAPRDATPESVLEAYTMAYDLGLKGLAYYRDGSRDKQVLYREDPSERMAALEARIAELESSGTYAFPSIASASSGNGFDNMPVPAISFQSMDENACPVCGSQVVRQEGCSKCQSCSWSAC